MEPVTLTTERLLLRPFEPRDIEAVHRACQDPEIPRWTTVPSPYTPAHAESFVNDIAANGWHDDTLYNFGVFTREAEGERDGRDAGQLVGSMGLVRLAQLHTPERQAELGFWTAKEHRGRGYTVEAAHEICRWAFDQLGVERLEWHAEAGNEASRAVAVKTGFRMEGTMRAKTLHTGTRRDVWIGSLLPSDWGRTSGTAYLPYGKA